MSEMRADALAEAFASALAARDFGALASLLSPAVHMRALIPAGLRECAGSASAAALFADWFGACDPIETLGLQAETMADRVRIAYRLRLVEDGAWFEVEQQVFCSVAEGRITTLDLLCSGFRPAVRAA